MKILSGESHTRAHGPMSTPYSCIGLFGDDRRRIASGRFAGLVPVPSSCWSIGWALQQDGKSLPVTSKFRGATPV